MINQDEFTRALRDQLQKIKREHSAESFQTSLRLTIDHLRSCGPEYVDLAREAFQAEGLHFEDTPPVRESIPAQDSSTLVTEIRKLVPGIQTQAQFDVFMAGFRAYTLGMQSIFEGKKTDLDTTKESLISTLDLAVSATELAQKLRDVGEASIGEGSEAHKKEPKEFTEGHTQKSLLDELETIVSLDQLQTWYQTHRQRIDQVQTPTLRNGLLDRIRVRQNELRQL